MTAGTLRFNAQEDSSDEASEAGRRRQQHGRTLTDVDVAYAAGTPGGDPDSDDIAAATSFVAQAPSGGAGAGGTSTGAAASAATGTASGGLVINVTYDQSQSSLPAGFVAAINYVVNYYESIFTNPVTVNIDVGYGEIAGQTLASGALGESETYVDEDSYSQVVTALKANATSSAQQAAFATLLATSPLGSDSLWVATSEEKALGLISGTDTDIDGYTGFSSVYPFSYSTGTPPSGEYYFIGVVEHEFSEVMGRDSFLGDGIGGTTSYSAMDLFRYSAPGERDLTKKPPVANTAYFSINSGTADLANWNTNASGDLGDWASTAGDDAYLAFSPSGVANVVTPADLEVMNVLGWNEPGSGTVVSGTTDTVSSSQTSSGVTLDGGGVLAILPGGTAEATVVSSGGYEFVASGGSSSATVVDSGGYAYAAAGATYVNTVDSGGTDLVAGTASGTTVDSGGMEDLLGGGQAVGATISLGGVEFVAGAASGMTIASGGYEFVASGGSAGGSVVDGGGYAYAAPGATLSGTVDSGGTDIVAGMASSTTISSGGMELTLGGTAIGVAVASGGVELDDGTTSAVTVGNQGYEYIASGAVASGTVVGGGGYAYAASGAVIDGLTISGGTLELAAGASTGSGALAFSGSGTLLLEDSAQFGGLLAGFALPDSLDLADIPYVASGPSATTYLWSQATSGAGASGTLAVSEGGHAANITLLGQYAQASFSLQSDSLGGTLVTDPPLTASSANPAVLVNPQHA